MNLRNPAAALGAVLFAAYLVPSGPAYAFGAQWRPAPDFAAAAYRGPQGIVNVPSFRPWSAAGPNRYSMRPAAWRAPPPPPSDRWYPAPPGFGGQYAAYDRPPAWFGPAGAGGGWQPPMPYMVPGPAAVPGWMPPFAGVAGSWPDQVPLFARQFAWRPADQPWAAPPPQRRVDAAPRYPFGAPMPRAPGFAGDTPMPGTWRPVVQPMPAPQFAYAPAGPVYTADRYTPAGGLYTGAPVGSIPPAPPMWGWPGGQWRPAPQPMPWRDQVAFRPTDYGREPLSARTPADEEGSRRRLPGWASTYPASPLAAVCDWCGGS